MDDGLVILLAFCSMGIALFALVLPQAEPVEYSDLLNVPEYVKIVAVGELYDVANGSSPQILCYYDVPAERNETLAFGGWVRVSYYGSGTPYMFQDFYDSYNTVRGIALRYGGGGGYILNFVGFMSMEDSTFIVRNGTRAYIKIAGCTNMTFSAGAWIGTVNMTGSY